MVDFQPMEVTFSPEMAAVFLVVALAVVAVLVGSWMRARRRGVVPTALTENHPRRSRALARLRARSSRGKERIVFAFAEATALLWDGEFERAIALLDARAIPARIPSLGVLPILVKIEALLFEGRTAEARALYATHQDALLALEAGACDVAAIRGMLRFHEGALEEAREKLEGVARLRTEAVSENDPIFRAANFFLAAIAHREHRRDDARTYLAKAIANGGPLFIVRWALLEWEEHFPGEVPPPRLVIPRRARKATSIWAMVPLGLGALFFRPGRLVRRSFTSETVLALLVFDAAVSIGLRFVDYKPGSEVLYGSAFIRLFAPLLFFFVAALVGTGHRRDSGSMLRVLAGFYAALPPLLVASFAVTRLVRIPSVVLTVEIGLGLWALAVFVRLVQVVAAARPVRVIASAIVFAAVALLPLHASAPARLFWVPPKTDEVVEWRRSKEDKSDKNELMFREADRVHALEASLAPERPGVADLWFVGAAGWADQDVFLHEIESAHTLFDQRFDTRGHSLVLANDPSAADKHPMAANESLRHVLKAIGSRMNTDEDILFLAITSHGSERGLALRFPTRSPYEEETLRPEDLSAMLDEAHIRWRVLLVIGCYSGVFIPPLQNDHTLIATAAAQDRVSYGCVGGNPFTDFGEAIFGEELVHERSFATAFRKAAQVVEERERKAGITPSLPQVSEGAAITPKLAAFERRLFEPGPRSTPPE